MQPPTDGSGSGLHRSMCTKCMGAFASSARSIVGKGVLLMLNRNIGLTGGALRTLCGAPGTVTCAWQLRKKC